MAIERNIPGQRPDLRIVPPTTPKELRPPTPTTWEEILAADPDHPAHLDTTEGRFLTAVDIIKNGAMVLELFALNPNHYMNEVSINQQVKEISGKRLPSPSAVYSHHSRTIAPLGAAKTLDDDFKMWQRTPFGTQLMTPAVYAWQQIIDLGVNPAKVMSSISAIRRDQEQQITGSSAYDRATILFSLLDVDTSNMPSLAKKTGTSTVAIRGHLNNLAEAGLIDFKSASSEHESFTSFSIANKGIRDKRWSIARDYKRKGLWIEGASSDIRRAVMHLTAEGKKSFTIKDVAQWVKQHIPDKKAIHYEQIITHILSLFSKNGFLDRSEINHSNMSSVSIKPKGRLFTERVLIPLLRWSANPNSVREINEISRNPQRHKALFESIFNTYDSTSPHKQSTPAEKIDQIVTHIANNPGELTSASIGKRLGIAANTVRELLKDEISSGRISIIRGKAGRQYFYLGIEDTEDQFLIQ